MESPGQIADDAGTCTREPAGARPGGHAMTQRQTASFILAPTPAAPLRHPREHWQLSLVRVDAGVAAGHARRGQAHEREEWWTLFASADEFDACCMDDPLRFSDPLLFAQLKTEFEHVLNRPSHPTLPPTERTEPGPDGPRA